MTYWYPQTGAGYLAPRGISNLQAGELKVADDKVGCKGETMRTANGLVDDLMELVEYSVLVKSEDFVAQGQMVESKSDHLELPCKLNSGGCGTGDGTYIFDYVPTCTLEKIQVFTGTHAIGMKRMLFCSSRLELGIQIGLAFLIG